MGEEPDDIESWGWSEYFSELERFFADLERQYGIARGSYCDYATERLDVCELTLNRLSSVIDAGRSPEGTVLFGLRARLERLTDLVRSLRFQWHQYSATSDTRSEQSSYRAISIAGGRRGRPSFFVSEQQILYLRSLSFTWIEIASLLGISRMTLYRRRQEFGLMEDPRTVPSDVELSQLVQDLFFFFFFFL